MQWRRVTTAAGQHGTVAVYCEGNAVLRHSETAAGYQVRLDVCWHLQLSNPVFVCLSVCQHVCLSLLSVCLLLVCWHFCSSCLFLFLLSVSMSVCPLSPACRSACLSVSVCLPACLSICLPAFLSLTLSACLPACLSAYLFVFLFASLPQTGSVSKDIYNMFVFLLHSQLAATNIVTYTLCEYWPVNSGAARDYCHFL